jgi:hypothetical protein
VKKFATDIHGAARIRNQGIGNGEQGFEINNAILLDSMLFSSVPDPCFSVLIRGRSRISYQVGIALARLVKVEAGLHVALRRDVEVGCLAREVLGVEVFQERHAPLASRSRRKAFADEGGHRRILAGEVRPDLPEGDVKAQANVIVRVHGQG